MHKNKTIIIGVGNILRGDDGVGPAVIKKLRQHKLTNIDLHDGAIDGLTLIEIIKEYDKAIIVDAVNMNLTPGSVKVFTPQDAIPITTDSLSTHGIGLAEVIQLLPILDIKTDLTIIGIEPQNIEFNQSLSAIIEQQLDTIVTTILELV